jgi:hypothetical protein
MTYRSSEEDISILRGLEGLLVGGPLVGAIELIGNTGITIYRMPRVLYESYRALWRETRIGPNLKTIGSLVLPVAAGLTLTAELIVSLGYGYGIGFYKTLDKNLAAAIKRGKTDVKDFFEYITAEFISQLKSYTPKKLPAGKEPFDLKFLESGRALLALMITTPIGGVGSFLITLWNLAPIIKKLWQYIRDYGREEELPKLALIVNCAIPIFALVWLGLAPVGGAILALGEGAYRGYSIGIRASVKKTWSWLKKYHELLSASRHEE